MKQLGSVSKQVSSDVADTAKAVHGLGASLVMLQSGISVVKEAFTAAHEVFEATVGRFQEYHDHVQLLSNVLNVMGEKDVKGATQKWKDFANQIQESTSVSREQTLQLTQTAKAMGQTDDMTQKMIKTAADLSATFGGSVEEQFDKLAGSLKGVTRGLASMAPELAGASKDWAKSGGAIDYLAAKMDGLGEASLNTFSGRMKQVKNEFGDIMVSLGESISKAFGIEEPSKRFLEAVRSLKKEIEELGPVITVVFKTIPDVFKAAADAIIIIAQAVSLAILNIQKEVSDLGAKAQEVLEPLVHKKVKVLDIGEVDEPSKEKPKIDTSDLSEKIADIKKQMEIAADDLRKHLTGNTDDVKNFADQIEETKKKMPLPAIVKEADLQAIKDQEKALDELQKILFQINSSASSRNENEELKIGAAYQKQAYDLGKQLESLQNLGLFEQNRAAIEQAFNDIQKNQIREIADLRQKNTLEALKGLQAVQKEFDKATLSAGEYEQKELQAKLEEINNRRQLAELAGKMNPEVSKLLATEEKITRELYQQVLNAEMQRDFTAAISTYDKLLEARKEAGETELATAQRLGHQEIVNVEALKIKLDFAGKLKGAQGEFLRIQLEEADAAIKVNNAMNLSRIDRTTVEAAKEFYAAFRDAGKAFSMALHSSFADAGETAKSLGEAIADAAGKGLSLVWKSVDVAIIQPLGAIFEGLSTGEFRSLDEFGDSVKKLQEGGANFENISAVLKEGLMIGLQDGAAILNKVLTGEWLQKMADVFQGIADMPENLGKIFDQLGTAVDKIVSTFPGMMQALIARIPAVFQKLIDALPKIAQMLASAVPQLVGALAKAAPGFVHAIMDALPALIEGIGSAIAKIIDALPSIIDKILQGLPKVIMALMQAIPQIISALIRAIPQVVISIAENIGPIIEALIQGILGSLGEIVRSFVVDFIPEIPNIIAAFVKAIPQIVMALLQGIGRGLSDMFGNIFHGAKIEVPPELKNLGGQISQGFKDGMKSLSGASSQIFKVTDLEASSKDPFSKAKAEIATLTAQSVAAVEAAGKNAGGVLQHWGEVLSNLWNGILGDLNHWGDVISGVFSPFLNGVKSIFSDIYHSVLGPFVENTGKVFSDAYHSVLLPAVEGFGTVLSDSYHNVLLPAAQGFGTVFSDAYHNVLLPAATGMGTVLSDAYHGVLLPAISGFGTMFSDAYHSVLNPSFSAFGKVFSDAYHDVFLPAMNGIGQMFTDAYDKVLKPFVDGVMSVFSSVYHNVLAPVVNGLEEVFQSAYHNIFEPVIEGFARVFGDIVDTVVTPLKTIGEEAFGWVEDHIVKPLQNIGNGFKNAGQGISSGAGSVIDDIKNMFADGGIVSGTAAVAGDSALNDKILALVSPGEAIIPRSAMDKPAIRSIVEAILSNGMTVPQFAIGGMVANGPSIGSLSVASGLARTGGSGARDSSTTNQNITINLKMEGVQIPDQTFIRNKLMPTIRAELRRASIDGQSVIYRDGLRSRGK